MKIWQALLATALVMVPLQTASAGFDMQKPLICAVDEVFECNEATGCEPRLEKEANVPAFFRVDFEKKKLTSKKQDGEHRESDIGVAEEMEAVLIIKGTQNDQAWGLVIGKAEGTMSATVTGDQFSFVMFGDCTGLE
jgi:hypothetical protein